MAVTVIIGAQWGDEGKGKIAHSLSQSADFVCRFQGGDNAGHTVESEGRVYKFRLLPSGMLCADCNCVICDGVYLNPLTAVDELSQLDGEHGKLWISRNSQLILAPHKRQDQYSEDAKEATAIGTTRRGIGPAAADRHFRVGLRAGDMLNPDFRDRVKAIVDKKNVLFRGYYDRPELDPDEVWAELEPTISILGPMICDAVAMVRQGVSDDAEILMEGAQGVLLDLNYGSYPYVTSSHPTVSGALNGTGVSWKDITNVLGIAKAYTTRVGGGPFPTRADPANDEYLRERGGERGTVTGRDRGCGWLDLPLLNYAVEVCGFTALVITKADILDELDVIPVCTGHQYAGLNSRWPDMNHLGSAKPIYSIQSGWQQSTRGITDHSDLPEAYMNYLRSIEDYCNVPIRMVSTGPEDKAIVRMPMSRQVGRGF